MKTVDADKLSDIPGKRIEDNETFRFRCHPDIACFNQCCKNIHLFLQPYDVIRLRSSLELSSDDFLDQYVDVVLRPEMVYPEVVLRMSEDEEKSCPFVRSSGCGVYLDRPYTCRYFPMEQGSLYDAITQTSRLVHFFRPPDFCQGPDEPQTWTLETYAKEKDTVFYTKMTRRWARVKGLFQPDTWGDEGPEGQKAKMVFMALYNADQFRAFVFNSSLLKRYKVPLKVIKKIRKNDAALLTFGFEWVQFFLWGIRSKTIKLRK